MKAGPCLLSISLAPPTHRGQVRDRAHHNSNANRHQTPLARMRYDHHRAPLQRNRKSRNLYHSLHVPVPFLMNSRRRSGLIPADLGVELVRNLTSPYRRKRLIMRTLAGPMCRLQRLANLVAPTPRVTRTAALNVVKTDTLSFHPQARARQLFSLPVLSDPVTHLRVHRLRYRTRIRMLTTRIVKGQATPVAPVVQGRVRAMALRHPLVHCRRGT